MGKFEPWLAFDSAGERTILCDYPIKMFDSTIKSRSTKMANTISSDAEFRDRLARNARQVLRKCGLATDGAVMDEEMIEKLKGFLKDKLSAADHETLCNILGDAGDAPDDVKAMDGLSREKDRANFYAQFPDASRIRVDNSGIQPRPRGKGRTDVSGSKSFYDMFPEAARIRQL